MSGSREPSGDDLYDALGIGAGASDDEITRAYRRLARDRPDADSAAFADLTDAYDLLHDADRRQVYDQTRRMRGDAARRAESVRIPGHHSTTPASGREPTQPLRERDHAPADSEFALDLTFEQACLGTTATVSVAGLWACPSCQGTGAAAATSSVCADCGGSGGTTRTSEGIKIRTRCRHCDGSGRPPLVPCHTCQGDGYRCGTRDVNVRVPPGVADGERIRIPLPTGASDLVAVVRTSGDHPYFTRQGDDIVLRVPITVAEAALGAVITVPTLTTAVAVRIPPGTAHGRTMRVRGRGVPRPEHPGHLLLTIEIVIPTAMNEGQRRALEAYAAATTASPRAHFERPVSGPTT